MREQDYVGRAKLSPARTFESPMDVVETNDIERVDKLAILKAWEADEVALLRAEDEGVGGGEHAHLHKVRVALEYLSVCNGAHPDAASLSGDGRASVSLNRGLRMMGGVR